MREIEVMARKALTDTLWDQLQSTMIKYVCYKLKTAERSWKPYFGSYAQALLGVTYLESYARGKQSIVVSIAGRKLAYERIFFSLRKEIDTEWVFTDGSYVRCHQHASGARLGEDRAIGRSRGGATTKIHLSCDADGYPLDFKITGGEVHDSQVAGELIEMIGQADYFIADKGYDSESIRVYQRQSSKP